MRPITQLAIVILELMAAALIFHYTAGYAQEALTPREQVLHDARAYAIAYPAEPLQCFQVRRNGQAEVCITERQWMQIHADDSVRK